MTDFTLAVISAAIVGAPLGYVAYRLSPTGRRQTRRIRELRAEIAATEARIAETRAAIRALDARRGQ